MKYNFIKTAVEDSLSAKIMMDSINQFKINGGGFIGCYEPSQNGLILSRPIQTLVLQKDFWQFHLERMKNKVVTETYGLLRIRLYKEAIKAFYI